MNCFTPFTSGTTHLLRCAKYEVCQISKELCPPVMICEHCHELLSRILLLFMHHVLCSLPKSCYQELYIQCNYEYVQMDP